jgi:hypothetical protein
MTRFKFSGVDLSTGVHPGAGAILTEHHRHDAEQASSQGLRHGQSQHLRQAQTRENTRATAMVQSAPRAVAHAPSQGIFCPFLHHIQATRYPRNPLWCFANFLCQIKAGMLEIT